MPEKPGNSSIRIIAGEWRSRRLPVIDVPGLRPSGDRSRETLFNWLQAHIPGSKCVDLFAGTGALGFEAASRGAVSVALLERDSRALAYLGRSKDLLNAEQVSIHHGVAMRWLDEQDADTYNIIFVDPPFQEDLGEAVLQKIAQSECLVAGGFVYLESPASKVAPAPPPGWSIWKEKGLGEVRMQVFRR